MGICFRFQRIRQSFSPEQQYNKAYRLTTNFGNPFRYFNVCEDVIPQDNSFRSGTLRTSITQLRRFLIQEKGPCRLLIVDYRDFKLFLLLESDSHAEMISHKLEKSRLFIRQNWFARVSILAQ